jgi:hypothetical protein
VKFSIFLFPFRSAKNFPAERFVDPVSNPISLDFYLYPDPSDWTVDLWKIPCTPLSFAHGARRS